jgi:hypothetical protein
LHNFLLKNARYFLKPFFFNISSAKLKLIAFQKGVNNILPVEVYESSVEKKVHCEQ